MKKTKKAAPVVDGAQAEAAMTWGAQFLEYGKVIGFSIILALFIRCFVVQAFHIPTGSMIPTFLVGDRVLVNKFSYGIRNPFTNAIWIKIGEPQRGDVVVFKYPKDPKNDFVKRVIGLPGEKLEIIASQVYINDQPIPDERAFYRYTELPKSYRNFGPIVVPQDCYFMMGDNRDQSNDSREWGCVESALLRGKAWRIYWSVDPSQDRPFFSRLRTDRMGHKVE